MQTALDYRTNRDLFSNYYLDEHLPETEAWDELSEAELRDAKDDIMELWEREKDTAPKRNESQLEEKFIRPMFRKLGIPFEVEESTSRTQRRPDYGFFESEAAARNAFDRREKGSDFYKDAVAVADAKRWGRPLDTRGSGEHERDFENPSYQIHVYLQETPTRWAVLTDGKKWRLYYGPTSHRLDSYYEIDLPTVLEQGDLEDFRYFYLFFRHGAFLEDSSGECFLDEVYDESNVFAQELGEDLQDNIYEAIKVLAEGFLQYPDNDLAEDDLDLIHDSSLIYLYRLIFVLYAEAEGRELLDTNNEIYEDSYSLNSLKQDIAEELESANPTYRDWQDNLWSRLDELFKLIDQGSRSRGIPEEDLRIPAYNGGLFRTNPDEGDSPEARFLDEYKAGDAYLAQVIELLTRSRNGNGAGKIFVDYSSLDIRHLGSIYEGLLEYQLNVADEPLALDNGEYVSADDGDEVVVEKGEVYLTTDSGERKATGSYYTPEYVVEYIVKNTLGPLVDDIRSSLVGQSAFDEGGFAEDFAEEVFDLKILDPAMGSGHFLTSAIDYLAREIIDAQERQAAQQGIETVDEEHDINWARRQVAQRCIYGVDLNPLAVELAKVSLWLRTLAAEQPLAFLDHHLKTGNSLVGSDIEEIEELESDAGGDGQNATLADFGVARKGTIEQLMRIYQDFIAIENQDLADVKEMEAKYDEFERNKLRQRLEAMANVRTAEDFGLDNIPTDGYERMAAALEDDEDWDEIAEMQWYQDAQKWAEVDNYFHWKLEYPEVFYNEDGDKISNHGFDAVIGNPPYIDSEHMVENMPDLREYISSSQEYGYAKGNWDIYCVFVELATDLTRNEGRIGQIVQNKILAAEYAKKTREELSKFQIDNIRDYSDVDLFEGDTYTVVLVLENTNPNYKTLIEQMDSKDEVNPKSKFEIDSGIFASLESSWSVISHPAFSLLEKLPQGESLSIEVIGGATVSEAYEIKDVVQDLPSMKQPKSNDYKLVNTGTIERWYSQWGLEDTTYIKDQYERPVVSGSDLEGISDRRLSQASSNKIIIAGMGKEMKCFYDSKGEYLAGKSTSIIQTEEIEIAALINSKLSSLLLSAFYSDLGMSGGYITIGPPQIRNILSYLSFDGSFEELSDSLIRENAEQIRKYKIERENLNTNLLDYISDKELPKNITDIGLSQPVEGISESILGETQSSFKSGKKLKIGRILTRQPTDGKVQIMATAKYKPENPEEFSDLTRGYTETEPIPTLEITGLNEAECVLIEDFLSIVSNRAGGYAGFYSNATKTIPLIDRIRSIALPAPNSVESALESYIEIRDKDESLKNKITRIQEEIDNRIYSYYEFDDEDIELIESFNP